jgi:hypothetical protein
MLAGCGWAQGPTIGPCQVFPINNIWNVPVDQLPVSSSSAAYVSTIGPSTSLHPDFGTVYDGAPNGIPYVTVPGTQTKYPAMFSYADQSDPGPYAIPLNAPIEGGSQSTGDRHVISIDTTNCILYEMWSESAGGELERGVRCHLQSEVERVAPSGVDFGRCRGAADFSGPGEV